MNYFVKFPDGVVYEYTAEEIRAQRMNGALPDQCLIQEKGFLTWVSLGSFLNDPSTTQKSQADSSHNEGATKALKRYREAYLVANVTDGLGKIVQGLSLVLGGLVFVGILFFGLSANYPLVGGFVGLLAGAIIALPLYVLGILVAANGQMLKASLDSAVHSSPFLSLPQKRWIDGSGQGLHTKTRTGNRFTPWIFRPLRNRKGVPHMAPLASCATVATKILFSILSLPAKHFPNRSGRARRMEDRRLNA